MLNSKIDIKESLLLKFGDKLLLLLLKDRSTGTNIVWATDTYAHFGEAYESDKCITVETITGKNGNVIKPRSEKTLIEQQKRIRDKAEVFTPSWICNKQNNLVDNAWFGRDDVFNKELEKSWIATDMPVAFPTSNGKDWLDYVCATRLEISCGEAPYLVSRYDAVSDGFIPVKDRIGLLDRKLRIVSENTSTEDDWIENAKKACKSVYGYDWQGDNVLLARENLLFSVLDYYAEKFGKQMSKEFLFDFAEIIVWNIWQMDGLKFVIPNSCKTVDEAIPTLWGEELHKIECEGCKNNNPKKHNGIHCKIMDWDSGKAVEFVTLIKSDYRGKL